MLKPPPHRPTVAAQRNHLLPVLDLGPDPIKKCHETGYCQGANELVGVASCCWCKQKGYVLPLTTSPAISLGQEPGV